MTDRLVGEPREMWQGLKVECRFAASVIRDAACQCAAPIGAAGSMRQFQGGFRVAS